MPRGRKRKEESATAPAAVQETPSTSTTTVDVTPETPKESPAVVTVTTVAEVVTVTEDTATKVESAPADIPVAAPVPSEEKAKKYVQAVDSNGHVRKFYDYFDTPTNRVKVTRLLQAKGISVKEFLNS